MMWFKFIRMTYKHIYSYYNTLCSYKWICAGITLNFGCWGDVVLRYIIKDILKVLELQLNIIFIVD